MTLKIMGLAQSIFRVQTSSFLKLILILMLTSCIPLTPGGNNDIEIETAETSDPELVNRPATSLQWGEESVESGVSFASKARAHWLPSSDAPFFSRQKILFYSDPNCTIPIDDWISVPAGKNEFWIEDLSHLGSTSYRIKTYTDFNERDSSCSPPISVDLITQKTPVITSSCSTIINQNDQYRCKVIATDLNLQELTYSLDSDTCGIGNLSMDSMTGELSWNTDDDDFSTNSCSVNIIVTDTNSDFDSQALILTLNNTPPTLEIEDQSVLENSGTNLLLTDTEIQASDEGFGLYTITSQDCDPALGTLGAINSTTGEVSFTPTANLHGTCQMTIQFDDQNSVNNLASQMINVTVISTNQPPTISENCQSSKTELEMYTCQITATDSDAGDTLTYSTSSENTCSWIAVDTNNGAISTSGSVPLNDLMVGTCTLGVQVSDGNDTTKTQKSVTILNAIPSLSIPNAISTGNSQPYAITEIRSDAQVQSSEEPYGVYSLTPPDNLPACSSHAVSLTIDPVNGAISFRPEEDFNEKSCFIKVEYIDSHAASATSQFLLSWNTENSSAEIIEEFNNDSCSPGGTQNNEYNCQLRVNPLTNIDGDQIQWVIAAGNTCSWINAGDFNTSKIIATPNDIDQLTITDTPTDDDVGICNLAIQVNELESDGVTIKNSSEIFMRSINIANLTPVFNSFQTEFNIDEDASETTLFTGEQMQVSDEGFGIYSLGPPESGLNCLDPDPAIAGNESGSFNLDTDTGELKFTPASNYSGDCSFMIHFDDENVDGTAEIAITIDFNEDPDTPIISESCARSITEDNGDKVNTYSCEIDLVDPDFQDTFVWSIVATNDHPVCRWLRFPDPTSNLLYGVPEDDDVGTCGIKIFVTDSFGNTSDPLEWTITVNNETPTINPSPAVDVGTGGELLEDTGNLIIKNDSEIQSLDEGFGTYSIEDLTVTPPGCHEYGVLVVDPVTGAVSFQPAANWSGNCNVKLAFNDNNESANIQTTEFQVTITGVEDSPSINIDHCPKSLLEDGTYFCQPYLTDPDLGNSLTLNLVSNSCSTIFRKDDGGENFIEQIGDGPTDDNIGSCTLVLEAEDDTGNKSLQTSLTIAIINQTPIIEINVDPENIFVFEDAMDITLDAASKGAIILKDEDISSSDEGFGIYSLASPFKSPSCLDIFSNEKLYIDSSNGKLIGIPPTNYHGDCFLRIKFNDQNATNSIASRDIKIRILPLSDAPEITSNCASEATQGTNYSCDFNFTDVELNENHTFELADDNTCEWAIINVISGLAQGKPQNQDIGSGSCELSVNIKDGRQETPTNQKLTINLNNIAPEFTKVLTDVTISEDANLTIIKRHELVSTTEEGLGGTYSIDASVGLPDCQTKSVSISINDENGEIQMKPTSDFNGSCYINVKFDDGNGANTTSEFKVNISALADTITINSDCSDTVAENSLYSCTASLNDPDEATGISWSFASGHTCNWLSIGKFNGVISETPSDDNVGSCVLSYQATDGDRVSEIKQETITITNIVPSLIAGGPFNVNENSTNTIVANIEVSDNHEGFGTYSIEATTASSPNCRDEAIVNINPTSGDITYTPGNPANLDGNGRPIITIGTCYLTVAFNDGNGDVVKNEYAFNIQEENDPPVITEINCSSNATEDTPYQCTFNLNDEEVATISIGGTHSFTVHSSHDCGLSSALTMTTGTQSTNNSEITYQFTPTNVQSNQIRCKVAFTIKEVSTGVESDLYQKEFIIQNSPPTFDLPVTGVTKLEQDGTYTVVSDAEIETDDEADENAAIDAGVLSDHYGSYSLLTIGANRCGTGAALGVTTINSKTGAITFNPDESSGDFNGTCNFYVIYNDGTTVQNLSQIKQIPFTVTAVNDPPAINDNTCLNEATENSDYTCTFSATDPDLGNVLSWSFAAANTCSWLKINPITGAISGKLSDSDIDTLNDSCNLVVQVSDGTISVTSDTIALTLNNQVPTISSPTLLSIQTNSISAEILGDVEIYTIEELNGRTGGYSEISSQILGEANGTSCKIVNGNTPPIVIESLDQNTGAITVTTDGTNGAKCLLTIRFTDANGGTDDQEITITNSSNSSAPVYRKISNACAPNPATQSQGVVFTHCDLSSLAVTPAPSVAIDLDTHFIIAPDSTCRLSEDSGTSDGVWRNVNNLQARFGNTDVGTCDFIYYLDFGAEGKTNRQKITFTIDNVAPTFNGTNSPNTLSEDGGNQVVISDSNMQFDEEINVNESKHFYLIKDAAGDDCKDHGLVTIKYQNGEVKFNPNLNYNGTCEIEVEFNDGNGASATKTLTVNVNSATDGPDIAGALETENQSCLTSLQEGSSYSCLILHNDPDLNPSITWSKVTSGDPIHTCGNWLQLAEDVDENLILSGTPDNNAVGSCTVYIEVSDGSNSDRTRFDLTIADTAPEILITEINTVPEDNGQTTVVQGDKISVSEGNETDGSYGLDSTKALNPKCSDNGILSVDTSTGEITFDPAKDFDKSCSVYVTFNDGNGAIPSGKMFFVDMTSVNDPPVILNGCQSEIEEGQDFVCPLSGLNPEEEQELTWSMTQNCGWLNLHPSGVLYGKPNQNHVGTCVTEVQVSDQELSSTSKINIIIRNSVPELTIPDKSVAYSSELTTYLIDQEVQAREEGQTASLYELAPDQAGENACFNFANLMTIDNNNGSVKIQIAPDKRPSFCDIGIRFSDGKDSVYEQTRITFIDDLSNLPVVISSCLTTIEENSEYICYPKITNSGSKDIIWSLHPSNSCDWLSINSESGFIQGKPNNSNVGNCTLAFQAASALGTSELAYYDINITNKTPEFNLPNSGIKKIIGGSSGIQLYNDTDIQARGEGYGFYFIDPSLNNTNDCRFNSRVILNNTNGSIAMVPNSFFTGTCTLNIGFNDLNISQNTYYQEANINVSGSNSPPQITSTCSTEGALGVNYECLISATDSDGDEIQFELDNNSAPDSCSNWLTLVNGSGESSGSATLAGTPSSTNIGSCKVIVYARDAAQASIHSNRYEFEINIPNVPGEFSFSEGGSTSVTIVEDAPLEIIFSNSDIAHTKEQIANSRNLTGKYFLAAANSSSPELDCQSQGVVQLNTENGEIKYRPAKDNTSDCQIKVGFDDLEASDNIQYQVFNVDVTPVDDVPTISNSCPEFIDQNQTYSCSMEYNDIDSVTTPNWQKTEQDTCAWISLTTSGNLAGTPTNNDVGKCFLSLTVKTDGITSLPYEKYIEVKNVVSSFTLNNKTIEEDSSNEIIYSNSEVNAQEEGLGIYYLSDNLINNETSCSDYGTLSIDSQNGTVDFTPTPNLSGTCFIRVGFQENNSSGARFETQGMLTIVPTNDPPEIDYNCLGLIQQGQNFTCSPIFYDPEGNLGSYAIQSNSCVWLNLNESDGTLIGTPNDENVGACSVRIKASDGNLDSNEVVLNLDVINTVPILEIRDTFINKNSGFATLRSDKDVQATEEGFGDYSLVVSTSQPSCASKGSLGIDVNSGEINFSPSLDFVGICFVNVSFDDKNGGITTSEFKVTINDLNEKPTVNESCSRNATEGSAYSCTVNLSDDEYPGFEYTWSMEQNFINTCDFLSINSTTGVISGTPENRHVGTCHAAFHVSDGVFNSNVKSFQITVSNTSPTLTINNQTTTENNELPGEEITINADASGESLDIGIYSFLATTENPDCRTKGKTFIGFRDGVIRFEPEVNFQGDCYLKVKYDDENGGIAEDSFKISVTNDPDAPTISTDCVSKTIEQDETVTCNVYVTELDNEAISAINVTGCTWVQAAPSTGLITINPSDNDVGTCTLSLKAVDANDDESNVLTDIVLTVTNKAPSIPPVTSTLPESDDPQVIFTDSQIQSTEEGMGSYSLSPLSTSGLDCRDIGTPTIDGTTGEITFTLTDVNWTGICYLNVKFDDNNGKDNSVTSQTMSLNITDINDDPSIDFSNCNQSINEGTLYNCIPSKVEDHDLTYSSDTLTFSTGANHNCNWLTIAKESGLLFGNPEDDVVATCTTHILVTDSNGSTDEEQFEITVNNVAPTLNISNGIISKGTSTNTLIRTDKDVQSRDEGNGTYSILAASSNDCNNIGEITLDPNNGEISLNPTNAIENDCKINIRFTDDQNSFSDSEFTVFVKPVNDLPVLTATCESAITQGDSYGCSQQPTATANNGSTLIYLTGPNHTCLWVNLETSSGMVSGVPSNSHIGECLLEIQAYDGIFFSDSYTQNITVANKAPTLDIPAQLTFTEDFPGVRSPLNDTDVEASEEGSGTYSIAEDTAGTPSCTAIAEVTIQSNGAVTFNAPDNFEGTCFIKIVFDDGQESNNLVSDETQIDVIGENDDPTIDLTNCNNTPTQEDYYECNITVNEPDLNDSLVFSFGDDHTCLWASLSQNSGKITANLTNNDVGPCILSVKVQDLVGVSSGTFDIKSRSITVNNVAPTLTIDTDVFLAAGSANVEILSDQQVQANEEGSGIYEIDDTNITGTKCSDNASLNIDSKSGFVMMDIDNNFTGTCNINIKFDDQKGQSVSDTVIVTVTNDVNLIAPQISNNSLLVVNQGDVNIPLKEYLEIHDFDSSPANVIFTLNSVPKYGELKVNTTVLNQNETFTLNDLQAGNITYHHGNFYSSADSFNFSVTDGNSTISGKTFNIKINDRRDASYLTNETIFANDGKSFKDLSSKNKNFFENGYSGDRPIIDATEDPIRGGYIEFPEGESNFNLKIQNLFDDENGFDSNGFAINFYMKSDTTVESMIMATQGYDFSAAGELGWGLKVLEGGELYFKANGTGDVVELTSTDLVNDDRWHAITITRIGSNLKMYINGISQGTPAAVSTVTFNSKVDLIIGAEYESEWEVNLPNALTAIDEIRILKDVVPAFFFNNHFNLTCPTNFVMVPNSLNSIHLNPFCVAKYEMKEVDVSTPISKAADIPWSDVSQSEARILCSNMGLGFSLIDNNQWMSMANHIETEPSNWSNGTFVNLETETSLSRGNFESSEEFAASENDSEYCISVTDCNSSGDWDQKKRTFKLSNGEVIWDLAGNANEHVDAVILSDKPGPLSTIDPNYDVNDATPTTSLSSQKYRPYTSTDLSTEEHAIGTYIPGENGSGGIMLRGGGSSKAENGEPLSGLYFLDLSNAASQQAGFRCIFLIE